MKKDDACKEAAREQLPGLPAVERGLSPNARTSSASTWRGKKRLENRLDGGHEGIMVRLSVYLHESEIKRIKAILAETGEDTSIESFIAVGAAHYIEAQERALKDRT